MYMRNMNEENSIIEVGWFEERFCFFAWLGYIFVITSLFCFVYLVVLLLWFSFYTECGRLVKRKRLQKQKMLEWEA